MGTMSVVDQELARWQQLQQQQQQQCQQHDQPAVTTAVLSQGVVASSTGEQLLDEKMVQLISTIQHGTHGPIARTLKKSKNPCGCVPPPTPPPPLILPSSSLSVTTSHSSCCASNSPPSSHPSSPDCTSPLILTPHPISSDSLPPAPSLPSLRLSVPHFDVAIEHCLNTTSYPVLKRSTSSPSLLGAPPLASPAGSVLSFQSIAGETYRPGILLTPSSSLFSRLPPSSRSAPWPFARSRSFDPGSLEPPSLFPGSSIALLSSVSAFQQQRPLRHQRWQQLESSTSLPYDPQHQGRQDNLQPLMESNQASSNDHRTRRRHGHQKALHSSTAGSNTPRLRSRSTSSLVHLAQSFMEDSLLFRSSVAASSPNDHHRHSSLAKSRASHGKTKRPLSIFASMTSITPITTNTTTSTPHGTPTLSLRSNRGEAKRIRGQNRRLTTAQPRKSLADLLFEAQSHYISHRYPQALALYLEAVCEHESVQACNSLYALYTAAKQERGLVRSDTRATRALIHALQIWARKRWPQANVSSDPIVSSLMNLEPLLQTIYATCEQQQSPTSHTHSQPTSPTSASSSEEKSRRRDLIESFFADGSSRFWRRGQMESRSQDSGESAHHHSRQGAMTDDNLALGGESEDDDESGSEISGSGESDDDGDESDVESFLDGEDDSDADSSEEELDPEQRGQATGEIEDIVQRLCQMIQKGVLGLDEPIVLDAIAMLQWIAHELASEADEHHKQERQETLLQQSSLGAIAPTGSPREFISGKSQDDAGLQASPGLLLLIQPLQFSDADDEVASTANSVKRGSSPAPSRPLRHSTASSVRSGSHHRGANLTPGQQALDLTFCRAMRIRIMSMLGWVHHQRHEYKYGAQAYAVCSEIMPKTGRIQVDTLQRKAAELMRHCQEMDLQQKRDAAGTSTSCSSGASINSIHSSSATLYQAFDISTPSTISTTETNSVCPLSAEGDHNSASTQQHHHVMASDAQVLEAAIRIASLAMESRRKPTVYEGAPVLAAEREARRASAHEEDPAPPLPSPTSSTASSTPKTHVKDEGYHQSPSFSRSVGSSKSRKSRSRSRGRVSADGSIKGYAQNSRALRIQTEPSLLSKAESRLTQVVTTGATSSSLFSRRPALGGHAHSMPQLQPSHHYHHLHHHHHRHLHHPKVQQPNRPKASGLVFGQPPKNPTQVTLSTCGHCGKKGTQMPLCVCKTTRYCNRDCRVADMEAHRATGCHAALIGGI